MKAYLTFAVLALALSACGNKAALPSCFGGSTECDTSCVDLMSDQDNCGACGAACGADTVCTAGTCAPVAQLCNNGAMMCGTDCVDPMVDVDNCGGCGTACSADQRCLGGTCADSTWITVGTQAEGDQMFATSIDPGVTTTYVLLDGSSVPPLFESFALPTTAMPMGTFTAVASPPTATDYESPTLIGGKYYLIDQSSVYAYDPTADSWATVANATLTHLCTYGCQSATDGAGKLYALANDGNLIQFDTATTTANYYLWPGTTGLDEPRTVYDAQSKKLFLTDYSNGAAGFYSFDPATSTFSTVLAEIPTGGISDGVCPDGHGHLYAADGAAGGVNMYAYDIATDMWSSFVALPGIASFSASCTVTSDGWLYFAANDAGPAGVDELYGYRLFVPGSGGTN